MKGRGRTVKIGVALMGMVALVLATVGLVGGKGASPLACEATTLHQGTKMIQAYRRAGKFPAVQASHEVWVEVPPIHFTGEGSSSTLPSGPCQHIYRFRFPRIRAAAGRPSPFRYVEVDWNTEGKGRGPHESFVSPHFDFHFYLPPRKAIDARTKCGSSNGKTCDPFLTGYAQMRRFLRLPPPAYVPSTYRPDVDSSIPLMGMHLLDTHFTYTVPYVNRHPVLLYGTFDGKVEFAEASVTLQTLQEAVEAPERAVSFRFRQPRRVRRGVPWPTRFSLEYLPETGAFRAGFTGLRTLG
ncbi:MAG: hypothetical protein ACTHN3_10050 [Solirubrobacterales bacterium]